MIEPDPLSLASGLLETPQRTPKIDKGTVANFISRWVPRAVEQTSDLTTIIFFSCPVTVLLSDPQEHFPTE
jgi:hypothetical protein